MSDTNVTFNNELHDKVTELTAISSTATTQTSTVDLLSALKEAKSGDYTTQTNTTTNIPETKTHDKKDTDDAAESVK